MNPDEAVLLWVDEYSRMAESYDANVVPRFAPFAERLVQRADLRSNSTILDVSTGTGNTALLAAKAIGGTGLVVGIDLADGALALAQTKAARLGLRNLRFEMLDSRNIVYRTGTFDAVLSSFGLPSIGHEQVLREIHRVVKDGAAFHLVTWAPRDPPSGWDAWTEILEKNRTPRPSKVVAQLREASDLLGQCGDGGAIRDPAVMTAKMRAAGFSQVEAEPFQAVEEFATVDELIAFHSSWGFDEREIEEMGDERREVFREAITRRFREHTDGGRVRLRWSVVFYEARK